MSTGIPRSVIKAKYFEAAQEYLRNLTFRNLMEARAQATQREITLESLALVRADRSDFHLFNEMLVQYPWPQSRKKRKIGQVVPDNMVVLHAGEIEVDGSYDVPLQPAPPFWVLEYVSPNNTRKDYEINFKKYEQELRVPYYLIFAPPEQELSLFHHNGDNYVSVLPNDDGRLALSELDLEMALLDRWVRFWYRGELLPVPSEWLKERNELKQKRDDLQQERDDLQQERDKERQAKEAAEAEIAKLKAQLQAMKECKE